MSIQLSLNGLSFSTLDTITNKLLHSNKITFKTEATPYLLLRDLKSLFHKENILDQKFEEVVVIHHNNFYGLVPKSLFDKEVLSNYIKFNTKLFANDEIIYDFVNPEIICVYVPFTNINNYLFECFGEFEFKHGSTVILQNLMHQNSNKTICYTHVGSKSIEVAILDQRKLLFYNQFNYKTKEDFLYYILFTYEQLRLSVNDIELKLFGNIDSDSDLFEICNKYIKHVSVFIPKHGVDNYNNIPFNLTFFGN